jgi:hypothetical protein
MQSMKGQGNNSSYNFEGMTADPSMVAQQKAI